MRRSTTENPFFSRRALLKGLGIAPLLLRPSPIHAVWLPFEVPETVPEPSSAFSLSDIRLKPHYPARSPLEDVLHHVLPGSDEYLTEKHAFEIQSLLKQWGKSLRESPENLVRLRQFLAPAFTASPLRPIEQKNLRDRYGISVTKRTFSPHPSIAGRDNFLIELQGWLGSVTRIKTAEFEITGISESSAMPLSVRLHIRYNVVATRTDHRCEERVGIWQIDWVIDNESLWKATTWQASEETLSVADQPMFVDITEHSLGSTDSYRDQLLHGSDYWRTVLDGASGIDVYGNNGAAVGDYDNDGFDDLYVCQPAGLPNRLYHNRGDGTFEDVTERAGVDVLDGTACALFADFQNRGLQDLLVVCGSGPLLFVNQGDGTFAVKHDAFRFAHPPEGTFTHAALADYDHDGRLDIYLCVYSYYLGLDQYHYPIPYFDARNGPTNFLLHNEGNGIFVDTTEAAGLNAENDRYSFACAWGEAATTGSPDLYVVNDFGRSNLYQNNGNGTFTAVSHETHADDAGAGMSASWADIDNDGKQDLYAANMWSAAGQRVSSQKEFHAEASDSIRQFYAQHALGNSLYRNLGKGQFQNVSQQAGANMGRWAWSSDFWDFDHDGYPDIYIANGYISAADSSDLSSFFWRQVVGKSPDDATPNLAYEHGWQALNELIRSDHSWAGYERNVLLANNRDGTFSEVSGALGMDFPEDSRTFVLADLDHDGRQEVILKNRNAPQVRILHNAMEDLGHSILFRLRGTKSNRDAIGAAITVVTGDLRQTKYLQAGSGFLAQHSKEVFFGVGKSTEPVTATILWPSGLSQVLEHVPLNHRIECVEGTPSFVANAFVASPRVPSHAEWPTSVEPLPHRVETWLIEPLKAPDFSLPDLAGKMRNLLEFRGRCLLLSFWVMDASLSRDQLKLLNHHKPSFTEHRLEILAINLDELTNGGEARSFAMQVGLSFPAIFANPEVAGIYNIIYRFLFDRRRDLQIPTSFLLDQEGMIVKIYQGPIVVDHLLEDVRAIPAAPASRIQKALPFRGKLHRGDFLRNDFTYGVAMFQHGYLEQAATSFQQVIEARPDDAEGYYNLGTLSLRRNDFLQAQQYLKQALSLRPNYPEAWNNLGMMAAQRGRPEEAIQAFQQSLQLRPGYAIALLNIGNVYRRQGAFEKAQESLNHALTIQPDDPEINYSLGMFYAQQNQLPRASEYLQRAIDLRPDYPEALNNLGVLRVREHDYVKAERAFKMCIQIVPGFDQSYLNLARLYALQDNKTKAKEVLEELLRLQPQNPAAKQALDLLDSVS
jgi:Flp pilus assembly protein TadD/peroxiredoxin